MINSAFLFNCPETLGAFLESLGSMAPGSPGASALALWRLGEGTGMPRPDGWAVGGVQNEKSVDE